MQSEVNMYPCDVKINLKQHCATILGYYLFLFK